MAGRFFSRKSKNGANASAPPPPTTPDATVYDPIPAPALLDEPPDALPGVPDLYAVLGVDPRSSDDIIRYAYRRKAAKLMDARWRPGRAARRLAEINAAYEILGKPDRRADYDRQRARIFYYQQAAQESFRADNGTLGTTASIPAARPRRQSTGAPRRRAPRGLLEAIAILGVVLVAAYAGYVVVQNWSKIDLGRVQDAGAAVGLPIRPRPAPTVTATVGPLVTPTPRQVLVPQVEVPTSTALPATPTPEPTKPRAAGPVQGTARMSNQSPPRQSDVSVTARFTRDGQPLAGVPVYLISHYKTVDERSPAGNATETTNDNGEATISYNIGDATVGYLVTVDVVGTVDNQEVRLQTSFVPR